MLYAASAGCEAAIEGRGQKNELIIRVGASAGSGPRGMPRGWDFEKHLYIPGIYDSVELILSGEPQIMNIQAAPDIDAKRCGSSPSCRRPRASSCAVTYEVREAKTGTAVGDHPELDVRLAPPAPPMVDMVVPLKSSGCGLPKTPSSISSN